MIAGRVGRSLRAGCCGVAGKVQGVICPQEELSRCVGPLKEVVRTVGWNRKDCWSLTDSLANATTTNM
eukprot:1834107-Amphidinium_carterae.1